MSAPRNDLTDEQELFLRDIIDNVEKVGLVLPADIIFGFMSRLGYRILPNGVAIRHDTEVKSIFGDPDPYRKYKDEYGPDGEAIRAANNDSDTDTPSPSESPESDTVGDVLQQDV